MRTVIVALALSACACAPEEARVLHIQLDETHPDDTVEVIVPPDREPCVGGYEMADFRATPARDKDGNYVCSPDGDRSWCLYTMPAELIPVLDEDIPVCP